MVKDMISVIVPCYNVSRFLDDCFKSIENQTYKNIEVIFVNDGSKDDTLEKIKKFCDGKAYCRYIDQENQGASKARNTGVAAAQGEFLYFFDSDDLLYSNTLEALVKAIEGKDVAIHSMKRKGDNVSYPDGGDFVQKEKKAIVYNGTEEILIRLLSTTVFTPTVTAKLFRHTIMEKMKNYPNIFATNVYCGEDVAVIAQYLSLCNSAIFLPTAFYIYRQRRGSLIHSKFNEKRLTVLKGHDLSIEACKGYEKAKLHAEGFKCIDACKMAKEVSKKNYNNIETIKSVYKQYIDTVPSLRKAKKIPCYKRIFFVASKPWIQCRVKRRLRCIEKEKNGK